MSVKAYISKHYEGELQVTLLKLYQEHQGILSGNFYHWENDYISQPYEEQLETSLETFLSEKIKQVLLNAKKIRDAEEAAEQAQLAREEEAWEDGSQ